MYAAIGSRPDITYSVQRLAQFTQNPEQKHWTAVKRVLHYLKGTRDYTLTYGGKHRTYDENLIFYCDADWASEADRKSVSGYIILLAGGAVAWSSKKQSTVALSTAEAEYIAATHVTKQVLWHQHLFDELEVERPTTTIIHSDNKAAISIAHNPEYHARAKHIDIAYHFLRDHVESGIINFIHVPSKDNLADLFTKGLPRPLHQNLTNRIGVIIE